MPGGLQPQELADRPLIDQRFGFLKRLGEPALMVDGELDAAGDGVLITAREGPGESGVTARPIRWKFIPSQGLEPGFLDIGFVCVHAQLRTAAAGRN